MTERQQAQVFLFVSLFAFHAVTGAATIRALGVFDTPRAASTARKSVAVAKQASAANANAATPINPCSVSSVVVLYELFGTLLEPFTNQVRLLTGLLRNASPDGSPTGPITREVQPRSRLSAF
jgi:hypothetical protein